jgi:HD superfamily phosphohydrolase
LQNGINEHDITLTVEDIRRKIENWLENNQDSYMPTRILIDKGKRDPYRRFQEEKGPLNQISIYTSSGKIVDINEQSSIVEAIRPFEFFRAYTAAEDDEAKKFIEKVIKGARNEKKSKN